MGSSEGAAVSASSSLFYKHQVVATVPGQVMLKEKRPQACAQGCASCYEGTKLSDGSRGASARDAAT